MEDSLIYKSNMAIHFISIIMRAGIVFIPLMIIMGLLQNRVMFIMLFIDLLGNWAGFILVLFLCTLIFSAISLNKKRIKIAVDGEGGLSMIHGNGVRRYYNLSDTTFVFQKEVGGGIFRAVAFEWVIKVTDNEGKTEKIYAYAFSKHDFFRLSENVDTIQNNYQEGGVWD